MTETRIVYRNWRLSPGWGGPFLLGCLAWLLSVPAVAALTLDARDFGLREGQDATPAIRAALEACREQGADVLRLPPGRYDFHPERANEAYRAISNHDNGLKAIAFPLFGFNGLTIEGEDTQLIFHGQIVPFTVEDSRDITLRGFSIDWAVPFHFQGRVVAVDPEARSYELEVLPGIDYEIREGVLLHGEQTGDERTSWRRNLEWGGWFVSKDGPMVPESTNPYGPLNYHRWDAEAQQPSKVEAVAPGRIRLTGVSERLPEVGWIYVAKGRAGQTPITGLNRLSPAIHLQSSDRVTLERVTIHHAGGMGVIAERCRDVTLRALQVVPPPGSGRTLSTTADATHFVGCGGTIRLEDCVFARMFDDGLNVHGVYLPVRERLDAHRLGVRINHFQQTGHRFAEAGDTLRFSTAATLIPGPELAVGRVEWVNESYAILHFAEPLPEDVGPGWVVDNPSWQPDLVMLRCEVRDNRARSVLVTTQGRVRIEDCRFLRPSLQGILIEGDSHYWHESGPVRDVLIRGNEIEMLHPTLPVLQVMPLAGGIRDTRESYHRGIRVEGNRIATPSGHLVKALRVGGFSFRDNTVRYSGQGQPPVAVGLRFELSEGVTVEGNQSPDWAALPVWLDGQQQESPAALNDRAKQKEKWVTLTPCDDGRPQTQAWPSPPERRRWRARALLGPGRLRLPRKRRWHKSR